MLRSPQASDAAWIAAEIARPEVHRMLTAPPYPYRMSDAEAWLATAEEEGRHYVISTPDPAGVITFQPDQPDGDLGYWLAVEHWGRGYMTEAVGALLTRHFGQSSAPVASGYIVDNAASARVLTKLGFRQHGTKRVYCHFRQSEVTVQKMQLAAEDWARRPSAQG